MIPLGLEMKQVHNHWANIPNRLKSYDSKLFVTREGEVYTIWRENGDNYPEHVLDVHYTQFDGRLDNKIREMDAWHRHNILLEIERQEEEQQKRNQCHLDSELDYIGREASKVGCVNHYTM
jgi:hypothetical protein